LSGPGLYLLSSGVLTCINKFLSFSYDDGFLQPVVQTTLSAGAIFSHVPYHYFSHEVISDSSFTVSRLVKLQRIFRKKLNALAWCVIESVAKGCASRFANFDSRLSIVQSEAVFSMLAYDPSPRHVVGCTDERRIEEPEEPERVGRAGYNHPVLLRTMIALRRERKSFLWRPIWLVQDVESPTVNCGGR
jgi:hypothetical protein